MTSWLYCLALAGALAASSVLAEENRTNTTDPTRQGALVDQPQPGASPGIGVSGAGIPDATDQNAGMTDPQPGVLASPLGTDGTGFGTDQSGTTGYGTSGTGTDTFGAGGASDQLGVRPSLSPTQMPGVMGTGEPESAREAAGGTISSPEGNTNNIPGTSGTSPSRPGNIFGQSSTTNESGS